MARWSAAVGVAVLACGGISAAPAAATETLALEGGFFPDPRTVEVEVLATAPAAAHARGCPGQVATDPALVVELRQPSTPLRFAVTGDAVAGVVLATPDGIHHCAAAEAAGTAILRLGTALEGAYSVWPSLGEAGLPAAVAIAVSELDLQPQDLRSQDTSIVPTADPAAGRHALPELGSVVVAVDLVGGDPASGLGAGCAGSIAASRPDVVVSLAGDEPVLHLDAAAEVDTTLVVIDPDGVVHCNDDSFGLDPAITIAPAPAGDYAVWVGLYGAETGATAQLTVGRDAPERAGDDWSGDDAAGDWNPFVGRDIGSAREALDILLDEMGLGAVVSFAALEEPGPEAVTLTDVVLQDPDDPDMRLAIGRIAISDLDLEGLVTPNGPARFSLALEAIDYTNLAQGLRAMDILPLPELGAAPTFTLAVSLLPVADGDGRMAARFLGQLDRQIGLALEVTARPPAGEAGEGAMAFDAMLAEAVRFQLTNWGYVGAFLRAQAESEGKSMDAYMAENLEDLRQSLEPLDEGTPAAAVYAALSAMLADPDQPGVLQVTLETDEPMGLDALLSELAEAERLDDPRLRFAITFTPTP